MYYTVKKEGYYWFEMIIGTIPGRVGKYCRMLAYSLLFNNFRGKRFMIGENCHFYFPWCMLIGNNSHISRNCQVNGPYQGDIQIGSNVMIGPYVVCTSFGHNFTDTTIPMAEQGITSKPIIIGDDVWIGAHALILPGVKIGKGAIIGAGAVVTKNVEDYAICVGNPARKIRSRLQNENPSLPL